MGEFRTTANIAIMKHLIDPAKQKFVVILVAALVSFFGFQAAALAAAYYQIPLLLRISLYVYLFLVFWQTFIFDLHLKKVSMWQVALRERFEYLKDRQHWLHFQNYLILPGIIYWTTVALLYLNPFDELRKQVWIFLSTIALAIAFWYLKTVFYAHREASHISRQMIFVAKLYASFVSFAAALGIAKYHGYGGAWFGLLVALLTFLLMYQALFQHRYTGFDSLKFLLSSSLVFGVAGYAIYFFWNVNFYSGALVLTALYNTAWGIIHHKYIDNNLTREIAYEYLAVLFVILVIVFGTTNFAQRI